MSKNEKEKKNKKKKKNDFNEFYEEDDARKINDKVIIKRLSKYVKPYIWEFVIIIISVLISSFLMSYLNIAMGWIITLLKGESPSGMFISSDTLAEIMKFSNPVIFKDIRNVCILILTLILSGTLITFIRGLMLNKLGQRILYEIRGELFSHIESLSLKEIDKTPVGTFVTRVTNDTNALSDFFTNVLVNLFSQITTLIYAIVFLFMLNWSLTLKIFTVMPIIIVATFFFRKLSRIQFRRISYSRSRLNAFLSENLSGIKITQIFNKEEAKQKEFDDLAERLRKEQRNFMFLFGLFRPFIYTLYLTSVVITYYYGAIDVLTPTIDFDLGNLTSFEMLGMNLFNPIQNIAQMYNTIQSAFASAEKIFTILDTKSSIVLKEDGIKADNFKGEIEFKNVWFKYKEDWIIKGMSFHVMPGEVVSFVGPTGAGKTTILSLIGRYYDCQEGEILIDGINVKDYDIYSLRRNIGEMLQDVFLFTGTIKDNITLRDENITLDEVKEASKYVNADKFIDKLENGYDEIVKERGNNYSQGQRQLLSFARTIVYKPKMIILDEATSNIDTETEVLIQDSLEKIKTIGTTIMVAHRLSTIQHSDVIMFVDSGKIVESGNHQDLLKLKGRYYNLYQLQYE